jgi:hypothetical protein
MAAIEGDQDQVFGLLPLGRKKNCAGKEKKKHGAEPVSGNSIFHGKY